MQMKICIFQIIYTTNIIYVTIFFIKKKNIYSFCSKKDLKLLILQTKKNLNNSDKNTCFWMSNIPKLPLFISAFPG